MAQFKYKGEPPNAAVAMMGQSNKFRVPTVAGKADLMPPRPEGWLPDDIVTVADPVTIRALSADPRFEAVP